MDTRKHKNRRPPSSGQSESTRLANVMSAAEKSHIETVLRSENGNRKKTAAILGISRKTLWEKIKAYGIDPGMESHE